MVTISANIALRSGNLLNILMGDRERKVTTGDDVSINSMGESFRIKSPQCTFSPLHCSKAENYGMYHLAEHSESTKNCYRSTSVDIPRFHDSLLSKRACVKKCKICFHFCWNKYIYRARSVCSGPLNNTGSNHTGPFTWNVLNEHIGVFFGGRQ